MAGKQGDPQFLDPDHQRIVEFGNDFFDDDEERDAFVGTLMERRGYKRVQNVSWEPPEPADPKSGQGGGRQPSRPAYFRK